ncbi:MAG: hypothetical protein E7627_08050 [Ruminococcaceae bacterium]|nr:hypothetical protein [Oscillospiraceae bacterium]
MKKTIIICVVISFLVLGVVAFSLLMPKEPKSPIENGVLTVNGRTLEGTNAIIYDGYAKLPLLEVMSNIGFQIEWKDANFADIKLDDKVYVLNIAEKTLIEEGGTFDYLEIPPGSKNYRCEILDGELFLDSNTFRVITRRMGRGVKVDVNYSNAIVTIELTSSEEETLVFGDSAFARNQEGNLVSISGEEYSIFVTEWDGVRFLGELEFVGSIYGEDKTSSHLGMEYQTGMFAIKNDDSHRILIRYAPNNEWYSIYRKTSLPELDFSLDNCVRLELVRWNTTEKGDLHTVCGGGITDKSEIAKFLYEIRAQKNAFDAGLYDLVLKPDGRFENCYVYGFIHAYFEGEPNLAVTLQVVSFNDLAYSVEVDGERYVLPESWFRRLCDTACDS